MSSNSAGDVDGPARTRSRGISGGFDCGFGCGWLVGWVELGVVELRA
jgi:hypothetical protein